MGFCLKFEKKGTLCHLGPQGVGILCDVALNVWFDTYLGGLVCNLCLLISQAHIPATLDEIGDFDILVVSCDNRRLMMLTTSPINTFGVQFQLLIAKFQVH